MDRNFLLIGISIAVGAVAVYWLTKRRQPSVKALGAALAAQERALFVEWRVAGAKFIGAENTDEVITAKARALAPMLAKFSLLHSAFLVQVVQINIGSADKALVPQALYDEMLLFYAHLVLRASWGHLGDRRRVFDQALANELWNHTARPTESLTSEEGNFAYRRQMFDALNRKDAEYAQYSFEGDGEGQGHLYHEYGLNLVRAMGFWEPRDNSAVAVMSILASSGMLANEALAILELAELLGSDAGESSPAPKQRRTRKAGNRRGTAKRAEASNFAVGQTVMYRQGRGAFEAKVVEIATDGVLTLERVKDGEKVKRPATKVSVA